MCVKEKNVINNLIRKKNRDKRNEIKINECMVIIIFAHHISHFFSRYFIVSFCHYIFVFIFYILSFYRITSSHQLFHRSIASHVFFIPACSLTATLFDRLLQTIGSDQIVTASNKLLPVT